MCVFAEVVVSSTVFSAFISAMMAANLNMVYGRKKSILFSAAVFTLGSVMLTISWSYHSLILGRIVIGIGIGVASMTTPIYISEIALPQMRGTLVTVNGFLITVGQFTAGMVDGVFDELWPKSGWRAMLGLAAVPSVIMFYGFWNFPESPRWLAMQGRKEEAIKVLESLRATDEEAADELLEITGHMRPALLPPPIPLQENDENGETEQVQLGTKTEENESSSKDADGPPVELVAHDPLRVQDPSDQTTTVDYGAVVEGDEDGEVIMPINESFFQRFASMMADAPTRRALVLGCGLMAVQQFSGINTVMYYAGKFLYWGLEFFHASLCGITSPFFLTMTCHTYCARTITILARSFNLQSCTIWRNIICMVKWFHGSCTGRGGWCLRLTCGSCRSSDTGTDLSDSRDNQPSGSWPFVLLGTYIIRTSSPLLWSDVRLATSNRVERVYKVLL